MHIVLSVRTKIQYSPEACSAIMYVEVTAGVCRCVLIIIGFMVPQSLPAFIFPFALGEFALFSISVSGHCLAACAHLVIPALANGGAPMRTLCSFTQLLSPFCKGLSTSAGASQSLLCRRAAGSSCFGPMYWAYSHMRMSHMQISHMPHTLQPRPAQMCSTLIDSGAAIKICGSKL